MVRHRVLLLRAALLAADAAAASVLFAVVSMVRFGDPWRDAWTAAGPAWWVWAAAYGLIWAAAEWLLERDRLRARRTMQGEAFAILRATALVGVTVFALLFLVHVPQVSRQFLVMLFVAQLAFSVVQRRFLRLVLVLGRRQGIGVGMTKRGGMVNHGSGGRFAGRGFWHQDLLDNNAHIICA